MRDTLCAPVPRTRRWSALTSAAVLTLFLAGLAFASTGSAAVLLLSGPVAGDGGTPAEFQTEVKTNGKGVPLKLNFINFLNLDAGCTGPSGSFTLETEGISLPPAKVKKQGGKYVFSTSEGGTSISGVVKKNGMRLSGRILDTTVFNEYEGPPLAGSTCVTDAAFSAKSIYL
jgi:hypothetical protein